MKTILVDAIGCFVIEDDGVFKIFDEMKELLDSYPNRKLILTGANDEQSKTFGLDKMPYEVFTLKHNPEKTDPSYYKTLLSNYNLQLEDVIYFEQNQEAVDSARAVGINTYFYDRDKKDLTALKDFIDSNIR